MFLAIAIISSNKFACKNAAVVAADVILVDVVEYQSEFSIVTINIAIRLLNNPGAGWGVVASRVSRVPWLC